MSEAGPGTSDEVVDRPAGPLLHERRMESAARRWIEGWNARDASQLLELADPEVLITPLRLDGLAESYNGHAGVKRWLEDLRSVPGGPLVAVSHTEPLAGRRTLVGGTVGEGGTPFSGLYAFTPDWLISSVTHFFTSLPVLESVGHLEQAE